MKSIMDFVILVFVIAFVLGFFEVLFECGGISQDALYECHSRKLDEIMAKD